MQHDMALKDEERRLRALASCNIMDTPDEASFDNLTELAQLVFGTPIVLISLLDGSRQWFKSAIGLPVRQTPREQAFCRFTIKSSEPMVVEDALADARFAANPLVTGDPNIRFYAGAPIILSDGAALGSFCVIDRKPRTFSERESAMLTMFAKLAVEQIELRRRADYDWLTGAATKQTLNALATDLLRSVKRNLMVATAIAMDIDHFKKINDRFGHIIGDQVLARTIQVCRDNLRQSDQIARMGGEEFVILLPGINIFEAMTIGERLRAAVAASDLSDLAIGLDVTASFGVTIVDVEDTTVTEVLSRVDEAVYRSKREGRNRVSVNMPSAHHLAAEIHDQTSSSWLMENI